ncbi:MAG TPA: ABC transporter permease subunit [Terriglobia bacterium]|nr:ABC transporter permease subunit [Terriglobia bacterium]
MRNILAIVERELRAYFSSPIAYVVLTIFVFLSGIFFRSILSQVMQMALISQMQAQQLGPRPMDMPGMISRGFLSTMSVILLFIMPMLTMALFSEEKKRGTIELLLTAPLTDLEVVLGKFFAAGAFYLILLVSTWIPMAVLYLYGSPASGPILTAYLGLLLYGLAILAIGLFISTLTENQIIAAVLSFGTIMVLWLVDVVAQNAESSWNKSILSYLSILSHLDDFMKGILSTSHIIFYLSLMLGALFLTYRSIDSLRWRG